MLEPIIVSIIVLGAALWLALRALRTLQMAVKGGKSCGSCGHCPAGAANSTPRQTPTVVAIGVAKPDPVRQPSS